MGSEMCIRDRTALIVVGDFLGTQYERSKLYDPAFTTEFRKGEPV